MKNLKKVAKRIKDAVKNKEKIVLFCDSDLDGITSVIILEETIKEIGGEAIIYASNREKWGYGVSKTAVLDMKKNAPALLISLDCGISNFEGAEEAKKEKFDFMIIDHHKIISKLPNASLILDPNQKGDKYPFKKLANVGIVYRLSEEILQKDFQKKRRRFLELTTIATIADMVPREEDNKVFLEEGLVLLEKPEITSLKILKKELKKEFIDKTVSLLNVTKSKKDVNVCYNFLKDENETRIKKTIEQLKKENEKRKNKLEREAKKIEKQIREGDIIVFAEGKFPAFLAGSLGSRIIRKYKKPTFIYVKEGDTASGSARMIAGFDSVVAMKSCKNYLESFGGHPEAAGFVVKIKNLDNFKNGLIKYFEKNKL